MRQTALPNQLRVSGNQDGLVRPVRVDETNTHVQRLVQVSNEVCEQSERIAFAEWLIGIRITLQSADANIDQVDDVIIQGESGASLVTGASEGKVDEVPFAVALVVYPIL